MKKNDLIKQNETKLKRFLELKQKNDIFEFLRFDGAEIAEDFQAIFNVLSPLKIETKMQANLLYVSQKIMESLNENRRHVKGYKENIWEEFQKKYGNSKQLSFVTEELFTKIYYATNRIYLHKKEEVSINKSINNIGIQFSKISNSIDWQQKMFYLYLTNIKQMTEAVRHFVTKNSISNFSLVSFVNKINECTADLIDPKQFVLDIGLLFDYDAECNDYFLENNKVYYDFTSKLTDKKGEYIVVSPTTLFIKKWCNDSYLKKFKVSFVLKNEMLCSIYSLKKQRNINFISFQELENFINLHRYDLKNILTFMNHFNASQICYKALQLCLENNISTGFMALGSDDLLFELYTSNKTNKNFSLQSVNLFPPEINYGTTPKRKTELYFTINSGVTNSLYSIRQYKIISDHKSQFLERKALSITPDDSETDKKFRSLYRESERIFDKKTSNLRNKAQDIYFSEEISIRFTTTNNGVDCSRVNAYVLDPNDHMTILENTKKSVSSLNNNEIESWLLNTYPYSEIKNKNDTYFVRTELEKAFKNVFNMNAVSLKTLYYLNPKYDYLVESYIEEFKTILNTYVGTLSLYYVTEEAIDNEMKRLYEGFDVVTKSLAFKKNLSEYFDVLVMDKVITSNPIKQVASKILNQNKEYLQVRNALVVRHFDSKQLQDIYKAGLNLYKRGDKRGLAIIIKLFTGLETNAVCTLQWKDLQKITTFENDEFYQLIIRRKATFDGNTISGMDKKEKYRYIPVPGTLAQLLVKEKERQKEKYNTLSENTLNERAIIDGGKHVVMGSVSIYSPSQLNEIFRRILCKYIEKNEIILPTSEEQERKLDLNSYGGDMFKSNFRHYGLTIASFENCEIDYLLGNKQDITFARNYCDYSNDASQLILKCKIERYLTLFQDEESELAMLSINIGSNYTTTRDTQKLTEVNMVIHALADTKIEIETKYGYRANVVPIKGK